MLSEQIDDRFTDAGTGCQVIDGIGDVYSL